MNETKNEARQINQKLSNLVESVRHKKDYLDGYKKYIDGVVAELLKLPVGDYAAGDIPEKVTTQLIYSTHRIGEGMMIDGMMRKAGFKSVSDVAVLDCWSWADELNTLLKNNPIDSANTYEFFDKGEKPFIVRCLEGESELLCVDFSIDDFTPANVAYMLAYKSLLSSKLIHTNEKNHVIGLIEEALETNQLTITVKDDITVDMTKWLLLSGLKLVYVDGGFNNTYGTIVYLA